MSLFFFHDHKFYCKDSCFYSPGSFPDEMWGRYTAVFGNTTVFARVRTQETDVMGFSKISNPQVRIVDVYEKGFMQLLKDIFHADYVIVRLPSFIGICAVIVARIYMKPSLIELVGCPFDSLWNHSAKGKAAAPFIALLTRIIVRNSPFVLYVTERFLQRRYPTKGNTISCSNVLLSQGDEGVVERRANKIMLTGPLMKICTIGAVDVKYKGQVSVIAALAILKAKHNKIYEYHLIGSGNQTYLRDYAKKLGVEGLLVFHGILNRQQINSVLEDIDIYIQPSKTEGLPRSLIEAMSMGLPAIGSTAGGIPELLEKSMLFRPQKAKEELPECLLRLDTTTLLVQSKRNYEAAKKFSASIIESRRREFFMRFHAAYSKR